MDILVKFFFSEIFFQLNLSYLCITAGNDNFVNRYRIELNREQAKAKQCMKKLIDSECTFPSDAQELLDLGFSDHNPFCDNNRDPGATGKDQCDGVKDLDNPFNASAGLKSSVLPTLLFAFGSLLFFVKF